MSDCSCSSFVNKWGFGNCSKLNLEKHRFHGKRVCYVDPPSNCPDLRGSITNKDKKLSAEACINEEERKVRSRLGISNSLAGTLNQVSTLGL